MYFTKALVLCASLVVSAVAQANQERIAFTTLPSSVEAGRSVTLRWAGGDNTPVTITLKQGDPGDLRTVALITGSATGNSYTWTPSTSLPNAQNYALQITQDDTNINFTGLFSLSGGSSSSGSASSSGTSSAAASSAASASSSSASSTSTAGGSTGSPSSNATITATTRAPPSIIAGATGASGVAGSTGIPISRNATLSRATLSSTSRSTATSSATETSTDSESETDTDSSTAPTSSPEGAAMSLASNLALLLAGFAAVVYLA
ncbi:MAG: hypothetical protein Q9164_000645 [Protoblastenia rupestris]